MDVAVIGTGVTGCAVAYYLARYNIKTILIERHSDICEGTSKANTAIVHAGHDALPGSQKARFNALGNAMFDELCEQLDVPFARNGTLVVAFAGQHDQLERLFEQGKLNGTPGMEIIDQRRLREMEPNLTEQAEEALLLTTGGIVSPYELTVAMCENALINGAQLFLDSEVVSISKQEDHFLIRTTKEEHEARCVVNCAGVNADIIHNMVCDPPLHIRPRRGEYLLMDKAIGGLFKRSICQFPIVKESGHTKGVWVAPTVSGNLLLGPTATDQDDREDVSTSAGGFSEILEKATRLWPGLNRGDIISSFAGLRAHGDGDDFVVGEAPGFPGFFDCACIESPGLTSAPAIGRELADAIAARLGATDRPYKPGRDKVCPPFRYMDDNERIRAVAQDPAYGRIVCRCEQVTEAEVRDSIRRAAGARTLDAVKRRTRAGMGRCQGGFCCTRVLQILHEEMGLPIEQVTKFGEGSELVTGPVWGGETE